VGAVIRMLEMGVESYMLTSALIGVMAQRLVRQVCPECKTSSVAPPALVERHGLQDRGPIRLLKGRGCPSCYDSGYKGRMGVHEILRVDPGLQRLMIANPTRDQLAEHLKRGGQKTLFDDGLEKALNGLSTIEEVSRVVNM
jgi:type IV pilus assembly protein PilB